MMAAFNVTQLPNWGYNETDFSDPEDPRYSARPYNKADFSARSGPFTEESIVEAIKNLAMDQPYSQLEEVEERLEQFYKANPQKRQEKCEDDESTVREGPIPRYRRFVV